MQQIGEQNELASLLLSKARLHYELHELENAAKLARESLQLAKNTHQRLRAQQSLILLAQIEKALTGSSEFSRDLYKLLDECDTDIERAAIHYVLWQIEGNVEQAQQALSLYRDLVEKTPAVLYLKRLRELQALQLQEFQT